MRMMDDHEMGFDEGGDSGRRIGIFELSKLN